MKTKRIVFAGGPSTGKTLTLQALSAKNYCCFEEISRQVTLEAQRKGISQLFLEDPLLFSQKLLESRIRQFKKADTLAEKMCFFDRGIPEVSAYMEFKDQPVPADFKEAEANMRYDVVFIFPIWREIYKSDNERYETFEEAREIQKFIEASYRGLGYPLIEIPQNTIDKRVDFILKNVKNAGPK